MKNILLFISIFTVAFVNAQSINYKYLETDFEAREYAKCLSKAEKAIEKGTDDPMPYFFKALAMNKLFADEKTGKQYLDMYRECLGALKTAKVKSSNYDLFSAYRKELEKLQQKVIQHISRIYKKGLMNEADVYLKMLRDVYDDKDPVFRFGFYSDINTIYYEGAVQFIEAKNYEKADEELEKIKKVSGDTAMQSYFFVLMNVYKEKSRSFFETGEPQQAELCFDQFVRYRNQLYPDQYGTLTVTKVAAGWSEADFKRANTAGEANYLTKQEKMIIFYLNLARIQPKLFCETILDQYIKEFFKDEKTIRLNGQTYNYNELIKKEKYVSTLYETLKKMDPVGLLTPDKKLYMYAECWSVEAGEKGVTGHTRTLCKSGQFAECCQYGYSDALDILLDLLIDRDIPSFGHREICLDNYTKIGVSIAPHKDYRHNTVMDFE